VLRAFEQGGIFFVPHMLWHFTWVFPDSSEGPPPLIASYYTRGDVEDLNPDPHGNITFFTISVSLSASISGLVILENNIFI
jgi:hypothetical protein